MKFRGAAIAALCTIVLGWLSLPARAENPIKMVVQSPLALVEKPLKVAVQSGRWFALSVTLSNQGDEVQGSLDAHLTADSASDKAPDQYSTTVDLPTNSHKRVWLYVRMDHDDLDICRVEFHGRGIDSLKSDVALDKQDNSTRLVLTFSDEGEKLSYLAGFKGSEFAYPPDPNAGSNPNGMIPPAPGAPAANSNNNSANPLRPLGAAHDLVPTRWIGLDAADIVVLRDFDHKSLTSDQLQALRGYVAAGGTLCVFGGSDWQRLANSPLQDMWPVQLTGSSAAAAPEMDSLIDQFFRSRHKGESGDAADHLGGALVLVARGKLRPNAHPLCGTWDSPLMALQPYGAGDVLMLAVDPTQPPFLGWRGLEGLWASAVDRAPRPHRLEGVDPNAAFASYGNNYSGNYNYYHPNQEPSGPTDGILAALNKSPELHTPPVSYIAWFLALYVFFLVPVNYCVLRYFDKRELAWITVPVIVVVFSVMSYTAALSIKGRVVRTRQINIIQGAQDSGQARADAMVWLFSPRKTSYQIVSDEPEMVVADYFKDEKNPNVTIGEPDQNTALIVDDASVLMWDWRNFVGNGVVNVGSGVHIGVQGGKPTLSNKTPYDMRGVVLVVGGQMYPFNSVNAGATASAAGSADKVGADSGQIVQRIIAHGQFEGLAAGETTYDDLAISALNVAIGQHQSERPAAYIVGWSGHAVAGIKAKDETPHEQNLTLFFFRCPDDVSLHRLAAVPGQAVHIDVAAHLVSREVLSTTVSSLKSSPVGNIAPGERWEYLCDLPRGSTSTAPMDRSLMTIALRGEGKNVYLADIFRLRNFPNAAPPVGPPGVTPKMGPPNVHFTPPPLVSARAWSSKKNEWVPLDLRFNTAEKSLNTWSAEASLPASLVTDLKYDDSSSVRIAIETSRGDIGVNAVQVRASG